MDQVKFQKFKQHSMIDWEYDITTVNGKQYNARYKIQQYGFVKEIVTLDGKLMFDREFKPMDSIKQPLLKIIENDGVLI